MLEEIRRNIRNAPTAGGTQAVPEAPPRGVTAERAVATLEESGELPVVDPIADLARPKMHWGWPLLAFALAFALYLVYIPGFLRLSSPPSGDQGYYMMDTISLIQDLDLDLANNYANQDEDKFYNYPPRGEDSPGMSVPYPLPPMLAVATARPGTEQYSFHVPGLSVLLIPAWIVGGWFQLWWPAAIVFMCVVGALVGVNVLLLAHEMTGKLWVAWLVWAPIAFSNPIMSYSYLIFTELPAALLLIYAFRRLAMGWQANGPLRLLLIGACIGFIPWLAWRCVLIAAALGVYALVQFVRYQRAEVRSQKSEVRVQNSEFRVQSSEADTLNAIRNTQNETFKRSNVQTFKRWSGFAWLAVPVVIAGVLLAWFHIFLYGSPIPDSSTLEQGREAIFHWPWGGEKDLLAFAMAGFGQFFDVQFGLLTFAPIYLLAVVGMIAMFRTGRGADRRLLLWMAAVALPYLLLTTAFDSWHGVWSPAARYWTTFVPLLAAPLAMSLFALRRNPVYYIIYAALALPGMYMAWARLQMGWNFWPYAGPQSYFNWFATSQEIPFHLQLADKLPSFIKPEPGLFPTQTAVVIAGSVAIVLVGHLFLAVGRRLENGRRTADDGQRSNVQTFKRSNTLWTAGTWAVVLLVLGLGWYTMNQDNLKSKIALAQQTRVELQPPLPHPGGIAYLDGKVYITEFGDPNTPEGSGWVAAFDPEKGAYQIIQPSSGEESLSFAHPGDVKVGPDGHLYVLNNGEGSDALWVMTPEGEVVRRIELIQKTAIATGLDIGPDGSLYVADTLGGKALKYGPDGGEPLGIWGGERDGFNNPGAVSVREDGTVYVAEGFKTVQVLDTDGKFTRSYVLDWQPRAMLHQGDWLDMACQQEIISLNTATGEIRRVGYTGDPPALQNLSGIAYGAEGEVYVLDGSTMYGFSMTR